MNLQGLIEQKRTTNKRKGTVGRVTLPRNVLPEYFRHCKIIIRNNWSSAPCRWVRDAPSLHSSLGLTWLRHVILAVDCKDCSATSVRVRVTRCCNLSCSVRSEPTVRVVHQISYGSFEEFSLFYHRTVPYRSFAFA